MDARGVKWCMENGGLKASRIMIDPSTFQPSDVAGEKEPVVETFIVVAPDRSQFMVTIIKLKDEDK